jgi:hypothetical protein
MEKRFEALSTSHCFLQQKTRTGTNPRHLFATPSRKFLFPFYVAMVGGVIHCYLDAHVIFIFAQQYKCSTSGLVSFYVPSSAMLIVRHQLDLLCNRAIEQAGVN